MIEWPPRMAEVMEMTQADTAAEAAVSRVYELGYHIIPTVQEGDVEGIVTTIRGLIEKAGGSFIAEGAPTLMKLAYEMESREGDKNVRHDRGYFGWIKFEASPEAAESIDEALNQDGKVLRHIVFKTVREDTRAKMKAPTLREVKRTDTIKTTPRVEGASAPVSEADLDKALSDITQD